GPAAGSSQMLAGEKVRPFVGTALPNLGGLVQPHNENERAIGRNRVAFGLTNTGGPPFWHSLAYGRNQGKFRFAKDHQFVPAWRKSQTHYAFKSLRPAYLLSLDCIPYGGRIQATNRNRLAVRRKGDRRHGQCRILLNCKQGFSASTINNFH